MRVALLLFFIGLISCQDGNKTPGIAVPGIIQGESYDGGGEGVAYHDTDSVNNGSGKLNPVNGNPLHEFRIHEGVDISYTKNNGIDDNPFNRVKPDSNQLYVGWTVAGEWINYSIEVKESGDYKIGLMYTANGDGVIAFDIDGKRVAGNIQLPSTNDPADTIAWRQWHHWNRLDSIAMFAMERGKHVLRLNVMEKGNMNFDYFELRKNR